MSGEDATNQTMRVDKWLWCARFFKSRTLAGRFCQGGGVRINGERTVKAHALVRPGDVLTFSMGAHTRVIEIRATAIRRGPAAEAQTLYADLAPREAKPKTKAAPVARREKGTGRPTKRDRRAIDALKPTH